MVVAHACHPRLRASVSTWEDLICGFSYIVWPQLLAIVLRVHVDQSESFLVVNLVIINPWEMSLRDLWHKTYNVWLRVSEWYLFGQEKRMDCAHMGGGCDPVSPYWDMLTCSLVWKAKSCFVILGSLNNFTGDHFSRLQRVPAKFQRFWQVKQKFDNWKIEG